MLKIYVVFTVVALGLISSLLSSNGGVSELMYLEQEIQKQKQVLNQQIHENQILEKNIIVLQDKPEAIETIARSQLGLVKPGEVFVEVIDYRHISPETSDQPMADETPNNETLP
ncbi:FtsB family cell division protein [Thiomicrorhabdus indica]|uniref:FtsB family cell division protein n=1 Tax=Thiomicrorhabdus indica TaxID=2267253 RepID=UPI00102DDBB0|nr:septum formation initiator family protein [Thiomicrorhabdus indica]